MSTVRYDDAGQEVREGDLIYIVVTRGDSKCSQIGRIIKIRTDGIHYISKTTYGGARKNCNPTHFCRCESTAKSKPIEQEIDIFFADWVKKHKEFA
jgi:hypothetical protein